MKKWFPLAVFAVILVLAPVLSALAPDNMGNLQPFGALFFCGMACFGARWVIVPAVAWMISAPITNAIQGYSLSPYILVTVVGFALMVGLARFFKGKGNVAIFGGSLLAAVIFYLVTNTFSWAVDPFYAKSFQGWFQALWIGHPEYAPTWTFFVHSLVAQSVFTGVFLAAFGFLKSPRVQALAHQNA